MKAINWVALGALLMGSVGCQSPDSQKVSASANKEVNQAVSQINALANAKAIVIASAAYGKSHGNLLPGPTDFRAKLSPILSPLDRSIVDRFEWTFPGGDPTKMGELSSIQLGRIVTPGGNAVARADGTVQWQTQR